MSFDFLAFAWKMLTKRRRKWTLLANVVGPLLPVLEGESMWLFFKLKSLRPLVRGVSAEPFSYKSAPVYGGSGGGADKGGKNNFKGFKLYSKVWRFSYSNLHNFSNWGSWRNYHLLLVVLNYPLLTAHGSTYLLISVGFIDGNHLTLCTWWVNSPKCFISSSICLATLVTHFFAFQGAIKSHLQMI